MLQSIKEQPWVFSGLMVLTLATMLVPDLAFAGGTTDPGETIGAVLCRVVEWFTGPVGKGIATLAIIVIGVGALMGKVSWGMAIIVGVGVAVIFGADQIVAELSGTTAGCSSAEDATG